MGMFSSKRSKSFILKFLQIVLYKKYEKQHTFESYEGQIFTDFGGIGK